MKALVIADNEKVIEQVGRVLRKFDFEVIVYRWLLKALDSLPEITPHIVVVSAEDYPRHWKLLAQFCAASGGAAKVALYRGASFPDEERRKADALGVFGTFSSDGDFSGLEDLLTLFQPAAEISVDFSRPEVEPLVADDDFPTADEGAGRPAERTIESCSFMFTNPVSLALVTGRARNFDGETLEFTPDVPRLAENLPPETAVRSASLKTASGIRSVTATVVSSSSGTLVLRVGA